MKDIGKVNSMQIFNLWKNLTVSLMAIIATLVFSKILPYYLSPVVALIVASGMYFYIYNARVTSNKSCIIPSISILYSIVFYAFLTIILNLMQMWGLFTLPHEFIFFTNPFIPALILNPVGFVVILVICLSRRKLKPCRECRQRRGLGGVRGVYGILNSEAHLQLKNFLLMSGVLSLAVWAYYQFAYINTNVNARDAYIFTWMSVIGIFLDWIYFSFRYYNLYLDLIENEEIITPSELHDMTAKTYLRFYVVCGNYMYLTEHAIDNYGNKQEVIDTPFFTKQTMNGKLGEDVNPLIKSMTGVDGELRFFYGRKSADDNKHSLLRYFYFLDGDISDYPELETKGEWVSFDKVKFIYSYSPEKMAELAVYDITRLATIMLTEKIFDEKGYRKNGIKSYNPTFNLAEVRKSKIDFQDDKWIEISLFNSDTPLYKLKKWWKSKTQKSHRKMR